jgi:hypothetical protein
MPARESVDSAPNYAEQICASVGTTELTAAVSRLTAERNSERSENARSEPAASGMSLVSREPVE